MNKRREFALEQSRIYQLRAQYQMTCINSGAYKNKVGTIYSGLLSDPKRRLLTEMEILNREMECMQRHITLAHEALEFAMGED